MKKLGWIVKMAVSLSLGGLLLGTLSLTPGRGGVAAGSVSAATQAGSPTAAATEPVAVPEPSAKAIRYHRGGIWIAVFETLLGLAISVLFLFTGWSARIRGLARRISPSWFLTIAIYGVIFSLLMAVKDRKDRKDRTDRTDRTYRSYSSYSSYPSYVDLHLLKIDLPIDGKGCNYTIVSNFSAIV